MSFILCIFKLAMCYDVTTIRVDFIVCHDTSLLAYSTELIQYGIYIHNIYFITHFYSKYLKTKTNVLKHRIDTRYISICFFSQAKALIG